MFNRSPGLGGMQAEMPQPKDPKPEKTPWYKRIFELLLEFAKGTPSL